MTPPPSLLFPFGALYGAVTRARNSAYRRGWLSVAELPAPVISVGNLTVGGTGKTPLVEWICRAIAYADFNDARKRVCVLTRGYRRANPDQQVLVSNGNEVLVSAREAGDEPFLLAQNLIGSASVVANANRYAAGLWALENLNSEVFILDDGFQHRQLKREFDIVVIDATDPFGNGRLLPQGPLREPVPGLKRANCVVITRTDQVDDLNTIQRQIREITADVPIFSSRMVTDSIRSLDESPTDLPALRATTLGAFCGVGNPQSFFDHVRREGYSLNFTRPFPDHHNYTSKDIGRLVEAARSAGCQGLITTAKDATKLHVSKFDLPCYVLNIRIEIDNKTDLITLIRQACTTD